MKITRGIFSDSIEFNQTTDNPNLHFEGKNDGCLYCSSWKAPECPYHDKKIKEGER